MIGHHHVGVSAVGNAAVPENAVIRHLHLIAVVLTAIGAEVAFQACCGHAPDANPVSDFKVFNVVSHLQHHPRNLMPLQLPKKYEFSVNYKKK